MRGDFAAIRDNNGWVSTGSGAFVGVPALAGAGFQEALTTLDAGSTRLGDAAAAHLAKLSGLVYLDLDRTKLSDAGLADLRALDKLRSLKLDGTGVTPAGVAAFRTAVPDCFVSAAK